MDRKTATFAFYELSGGDGYYSDCRVVSRDGCFNANSIQLAQYASVRQVLRDVGCKSHVQKVYELDLSKYSHEAVLEFLRFIYVSETAFLVNLIEYDDKDCPGLPKKRKTNELFLAEEVLVLANVFDLSELRQYCVEALESDDITIDDSNFLRLAQLAGEVKSQAFLWKCFQSFMKKYRQSPENALKDICKGAPTFLTTVIMESTESPHTSTISQQNDHDQGFVINANTNDEQLFEEVSAGGDVPFADLEILCSDENVIRCHRNILARVPHFKQMLLHNSKESKTGVVEVKAFRVIVMDVLKYVYTGQTKNLGRIFHLIGVDLPETYVAEEVLDLAQQYGLYEVKERCHAALLESRMNHLNVLRLLGVACLYELVEFKQKCLHYFFSNRRAVLNTADWKIVDKCVLQAIMESLLLLKEYCMYTDDQVWTRSLTGNDSAKVDVLERGTQFSSPVLQLDNRTVMLINEQRVKLFDLYDHSVAVCSDMLHRHKFGSACIFNSTVYVGGGGKKTVNTANGSVKCERYDRATDSWERLADMTQPRRFHTLIEWKGALLAIGGIQSPSIEHYDVAANRWEVIQDDVEQLSHQSKVVAGVINNELWVATHSVQSEVHLWKLDLVAKQWIIVPLLQHVPLDDVSRIFERGGRPHFIGQHLLRTGTFVFELDGEGDAWDVRSLECGETSDCVGIPVFCGLL